MKANILLSLLLLSLWACDDFLIRTPEENYSDESVWNTEREFNLAMNALYRQLPHPGMDNYGFPNKSEIIYQIFTDDGWDRGNRGTVRFANINFNSSAGVIADEWDRYKIIRGCNEFIIRISEANFDESLKQRFTSEARFIRAINYARLNFLFGAVPLLTEPTEADFFPKRTTREKVFMFVKQEFSAISDSLPDSYSGNDIGRITKGAALAFKARHLLNAIDWYPNTSELYAEAREACQTIYNSGVYDLDSGVEGYRKLFTSESEFANSTEAILTSNFDPIARTHSYNGCMLPKGSYSGTRKQNNNYFGATSSLIEAFQMTNGKDIHDPASEYDPANPWENRDPRLDITILRAGEEIPKRGGDGTTPTYIFDPHPRIDPEGGVVSDDITKAANPTGYNIWKYVDFDVVAFDEGHVDYKVMRYAEVLLMYAEAILGETGNINEAMAYVNEVRTRVGMPSVEDSYGSVGSEANALKIILNERRFELATEGPQRFFDLRRHRLGETVFADTKVYGIPLGADRVPESNVLEGSLDNGVKNVCGEKLFNPDTYYLWPIPQESIDLNSNLLEDPE